jgi:hypothetical protein
MNQCLFNFPGHWWRRWWDSQRPWERGCRWARRDLSYTCPAVWPPSSPNIWDRFRLDSKRTVARDRDELFAVDKLKRAQYGHVTLKTVKKAETRYLLQVFAY